MDHGEILAEGFEAASDWVKHAEETFQKKIKDHYCPVNGSAAAGK